MSELSSCDDSVIPTPNHVNSLIHHSDVVIHYLFNIEHLFVAVIFSVVNVLRSWCNNFVPRRKHCIGTACARRII